jgi:hypothetical protein
MMWLVLKTLLGAGWIKQLLAPVGIALAAILTSFGMIQYGKKVERLSQKVKQGKDYQETREKIDEATKNNPTDDPSISLDRLREHYKP